MRAITLIKGSERFAKKTHTTTRRTEKKGSAAAAKELTSAEIIV